MEPTSFIVDKVLSEIYDQIKLYLKNKGVELLRDKSSVRESILNHINFVNNWSRQVTFKELDKAKSISKIYVQLDYFLNLKRNDLQKIKKDPIELKKILDKSDKHIVILGQPGAGKTTTIKYICHSIFHIQKFRPEFKFPILIRLRDLSDDAYSSSDDFLFDRLFSTLGLLIAKEQTEYQYSSISVRESVIQMIDALGALVVLDGFDEINPPEKKEKIAKEFEYLCLNLSRSKAILTSRIGDYNYSIENTEVYEINSLTDDQILLFAKKWLINKDRYSDLYSQIRNSPFYDTAIRPLTMAHLCALYERYGRIPDKPKNIYKKIVNLLVEEWDSQRMILRKSSFANFTPDRKTEFLSILAFKLSSEIKSSIFTKNEISSVFREICQEFSLSASDENNVIQELESQTGLFLQSGFDSFEFAHKSLQEYLTAEYMVKLPIIPPNPALINILPNELAIATSISIDPSLYFSALVIQNFSEINGRVVRVFLTRIILENPDFRMDPLLGAAILFLRRLNAVGSSCDDLIYDLIQKKPVIRESIISLTQYYRIAGTTLSNEGKGDDEIPLHFTKTIKKSGIESPFAIQINKTILTMLNIGNWSA